MFLSSTHWEGYCEDMFKALKKQDGKKQNNIKNKCNITRWFNICIIGVPECYSLNVYSPKFHFEILMPSLMVLGCEVLGWCWGHEGGTFMCGINAYIKEILRKPLSPFHHVRIQQEVYSTEEGPHMVMLAPWSQTSGFQTVRNFCCL